jgi:hypothetical protein
MRDLLKPYVLYVALYLGVALTGGSVVHLPLDPWRYAVIGLVGVVIFIVASVADARRRHVAGVEGGAGGLRQYVGWSVVLSLGLGMLSGGIQHFLDVPHYAAALLPLGVVLSFAAYLARERLTPPRPRLLRIGGGVLAFALVLYLGLDHLAHDLDGGAHAH